MVFYLLLSWGVPMLMCVGMALFGQLKQDPQQRICLPSGNYHMLIWYLPISLAIAVAILLYVLILHILRMRMPVRLYAGSYFVQVEFKISLYVLIFIACWAPNIVFYSLLYFADVCPPFGLLVTSNILLQSQGLFDCIVYGLTNKRFRGRFYGLKGFAFAASTPFLVIPVLCVRAFKYLRSLFCGYEDEPNLRASLIGVSYRPNYSLYQ